MKNLQYLKLFEAFESKTLTKVFNYVNKSQRGQFKTILEEFCNKIKFPMSKLSDDLFQYLPYNKALSLAANMEDEPCDAESDTISGEKCSGPTGDEMQGTVMRTWGRGRRKVKCDVCKGTGIKPKTSFPIKWVKFWFDKDGKYVNATATDGKIRSQGIGVTGTLDDNIDKYEVEKENLTYSDLNDYNTGDIFYFRPSDGSDDGWRVAMLYREGRMNYMLQNRSSGSSPNNTTEWRKIAKYSWVVSSPGDIRGQTNLKKLKLKVKENVEEEEVKPDPYTWNAPLEIRRMTLGNSTDVKEYLKQAHFALILDYVKMKEIMRSGKVTDTDVTKTQRSESREGALALQIPNEIKAANFDRYIKQISQNIKITDDISNLRRIFQRVFGFGYAGHYILQGLNFGDMDTIFEYILTFMTSDDDYDKERYVNYASRTIKDRMEANMGYNNNMKENLDYLITASPDEDHTNVVEMLIEVNKAIVKKIQNAPLETIEDAVILYNKIRMMRDSYRNSPVFKKCQRASNVNYYLEGDDKSPPLRHLKNIDNSEIPGILANFDQYINFINKL
jgi:hypothetical protein